MDAIREMLAERVVELEDERDALAAHVEYLTSFFDEAERASLGSPSTSLAHLKAKWQAEALEEVITRWKTTWKTKDLPRHVADMADELYQQAQEPTRNGSD